MIKAELYNEKRIIKNDRMIKIIKNDKMLR